ncbi:MAG: hypothetical protein Q7S40_28400 [Opitutaceae bacterium]|nr:hypothetical protein [Opitutaceae bacterium]
MLEKRSRAPKRRLNHRSSFWTALAVWQDEVEKLVRRLGKRREELASAGKSAGWKLALAAALKPQTTVTNRWLGATLHMGNLHEVIRKIAAWARQPNPGLARKLQVTPNPKA